MTKEYITDMVLMYIGEYKDFSLMDNNLIVKFEDRETWFLEINQMQYFIETNQLEDYIKDRL